MRDDDRPIEPQDYLSGVRVVDIGDLRVARGMTRRPKSSCKHLRLVYDEKERRIYCEDCRTDVPAFDAFVGLVERWKENMDAAQRLLDDAREANAFAARGLAAKELDRAWRKKTMVPSCPHCRNGLFPEDFVKGVTMMGRDYALSRLGRKEGKDA